MIAREAGYAKVARGIAEGKPKGFGPRWGRVPTFADPVLTGTARGWWDPARGIWE